MSEQLRNKLRTWLGIHLVATKADQDEVATILREQIRAIALEERATKADQEQVNINLQEQINAITLRIDELERAYATDPRRAQPKEPEPQTAPGFIPFSRRKKAYERANQSDGLTPTGRAILANDAAAKEKSKT